MNLSPEQKLIVESTEKDICCIACPGSGKTHTLVNRIVAMLNQRHIHASQVVAITYTVDAATELRHRLEDIGSSIGFIGTMHSYLLRVLTLGNAPFTQGRRFTVYLSSDEAEKAFNAHAREHCKYKGSFSELHIMKRSVCLAPTTGSAQGSELVVRSWYAKQLEFGVLDYDGIVFWGLQALKHQLPVHLFWDEGQDMSEVDWRVFDTVPRLSSFLVGDPDQSIYGFRGGHPRFIEAHSRRASRYHMMTNRRCSKHIVTAANQLIAHNRPHEVPMQSLPETGVSPLVSFDCFAHDWSSEFSDYLMSFCHSEGSVAILVRNNFHKSRVIELLKVFGVPVAQMEKPKFPIGWTAAKYALNGLAFRDNDLLASEYVSLVTSTLAADIRKECALARKSVREVYSIPDCKDLLFAIDTIAPLVGDAVVVALVKIVERSGVTSIPELLAVIGQIEIETAQQGAGVVVSTMHSAKGREWDNVLIAYVNDEIVPGKRGSLEEERRLMYVAATRARKRLNLVAFASGLTNDYMMQPVPLTPSRFVAEMGL